jgi:hypothetical protein
MSKQPELDTTMDPPAYTPASTQPPTQPSTEPARAPRTITDLRNQILANTAILHPNKYIDSRHLAEEIEVIVARVPRHLSGKRPAQFDESAQVTYHLNSNRDKAGPSSSAVAGSSSAAPGGPDLHYAVLTTRSLSRQRAVDVLLLGEERESVESALEAVLDQTERLLHAHVMENGRPAKNGLLSHASSRLAEMAKAV